MKNMKELLYIDLFCGAGGTSTGVESATIGGQKCARVIACVNHDKHAIASHLANHPEAKHYTEDIRTLDLTTLVEHTARERAKNPGSMLVLWASLECTNFSRAKGGQPRDADSRTLAEHLFRYIDTLQPDYIQIENVKEFMMWGDLDENGKPISKDAGRCYMNWVHNVCNRGYTFQHRILNAADYGAYTSRERFFGIFAKGNLPIVFPEPTHSKTPETNIWGATKAWKPVREVLELDDAGSTIFREKPLSEKTLQRIYAGLIKFVAGGKDAFLIKYNSMNRKGKYIPPSVDDPCPTVATQNRLGLAKVSFLSKQFSGDPGSKNTSIDKPAGTITCIDHHAFITAYYGNGGNSSLQAPSPTVTTKDRLGLVKMQFMDQQYGNGTAASLDGPSGTVTAVPKQNLVTVKSWLMNPQFTSAGAPLDKPCFTLIARMDKRPPYLITPELGPVVAIYDTDSPMTVKIKEFMALYGIKDICMRMLKIPELKRIMGFPDDYVLIGTKAEQKKYIGNAVETHMANALCTALSYQLNFAS
jgi:DNA (cytosine-5)-methyltransferase 1